LLSRPEKTKAFVIPPLLPCAAGAAPGCLLACLLGLLACCLLAATATTATTATTAAPAAAAAKMPRGKQALSGSGRLGTSSPHESGRCTGIQLPVQPVICAWSVATRRDLTAPLCSHLQAPASPDATHTTATTHPIEHHRLRGARARWSISSATPPRLPTSLIQVRL
jgi:hypothetical protein